MVGNESGAGGGAAELTADVRAAYDTSAGEWASGPEQVYALLARELLASADVPLDGRLVLDVGAGTGVAARAALAAGARLVVAVDLAAGMLRRASGPLHPVAADVTALPFRDGTFDTVLAAFCLNHLRDIAAALSEARRVGTAIAASVFAPGWTHPAKSAVDEALRPFGYRPPAWYVTFKRETEPQAGDPELLAAQVSRAGFRRVRLRTVEVPTGLTSPAQLASWRLGMAHIAPFIRSLDPPRAAAARRAAEQAVHGAAPLVVPMVVLTAS